MLNCPNAQSHFKLYIGDWGLEIGDLEVVDVEETIDLEDDGEFAS